MAESRVTNAITAAYVAADELQTALAGARAEMSRAASSLADERNKRVRPRQALENIKAARAKEVEALARRIPGSIDAMNFDSFEPYGHGGPFLTETSEGWALHPVLVQVFDEAGRLARGNLNLAESKTFKGRLLRDAEAHVTSMCRIVASVVDEIDRLDEEIARLSTRREAETAALRAQGEERLSAALSAHAAAQARLPAPMLPWANEAWETWNATASHPEVFAGMLRPRGDLALGGNADFGQDVVLPFYVRITDGLHLIEGKANRDVGHSLVRALLIRALAAHAPGTLQLTVFDPMGLGQSIAPILELAEYAPELLGGKVWSSSADLKLKLSELTAHVELVIQKYLRSDYETLADFNAAAGEIATPYRLLVVCDFPSNFDEEAYAQLRRIIETGPRCGVGTLLVTNADEPMPYGIDLDSLPDSLQRVDLAAPFGFAGAEYELVCEFAPDTDRAVPSRLIRQIIETIGGQAKAGSDRSVGFAKVFGMFGEEAARGVKPGLPNLASRVDIQDMSTWWAHSTTAGVWAPIGQAGARDVAALSFDSADHPGALLVGRPGSGKSTLLHSFIAGATLLYSPEELELHLIDFKEGVEFKAYAAHSLPHARSVAIESDREFGLSVLQAIQAELNSRAALLRGSEGSHASLEALRIKSGARLPRIVLLFDEFQVLFARNDRIGAEAATLLESLIRQGRGFGIHVFLASQSLSGLDALGSHVPQLLPVRILLPASETDAVRVLGEGNTAGNLLVHAGDGVLNRAGGAVEANQPFRGSLLTEDERGELLSHLRELADQTGFSRRPFVFEGNAPIPAEDTPPEEFVDEVRGADARTLRLRFGAPMAIIGSADINLRRESGANLLLVSRDAPIDVGTLDPFSLPRAVTANLIASAVARRASVEVVDFLPADEGLDQFNARLLEASVIRVTRRRQVPDLLKQVGEEVTRRVDEDDVSNATMLLVLYGMHRARDFDQDSLDYDPDADLPARLGHILRDGPEVGVHTFMWFETLAGISRRLPSSAVREVSWRLAGKMSSDDSSSFIGVEAAGSLREQQLIVANEDRGLVQRCTTIAEPSARWMQELLGRVEPKDPIQ